MNDSEKKSGSKHINVKVIVEVTRDENGNATYTPTYDPKTIRPTERSTLIEFKLDQPTPDNVKITSVDVSPPGNDQLGTPIISNNGKKMEITDANTKLGTFHLTFHFDQDGVTALKTGGRSSTISEYPEIENAPPP